MTSRSAAVMQPPSVGAPDPEALLQSFGLSSFRPGQREAVEAALEGRDSLVVMPTGGGKSLCYQLPALVGGGLVLVVSPLIALMADQLRRLQEVGVPACMLASGMGEGHNERSLAEIREGEVRLALVAPERFSSAAFRAALADTRVGLFVVDEAHCVTEWGHDFRPDYLRLHDAIGALGRPPVMALTATATPRVAEEIARRLGLSRPVSVRSGFDRPNIAFDVVEMEGKGAMARKRAALMHVLRGDGCRPAIVYCGTRKDTESVTELIRAGGISAGAYHAGMSPQQRTDSQEAFMDGRSEVIVATNAFGMGVDKADVHTVVHWALPTSLEAYYQEAGRAGRDGQPARAVLLAARVDLGRLIRFIKERETSVEDVKRFVASLRTGSGDGKVMLAHGELDERSRVLLSIAERAGAAELAPGMGGGLRVTLTGRGSTREAQVAIRVARNRVWEAYHSIERYSTGPGVCRRRQILEHFGDPEGGFPLGRCCDVCDPDPSLTGALDEDPLPRRGSRSTRATGRQQRSSSGQLIASAEDEEPVDEGQFDELRAWRLERAEGKPAYTVATDSALRGVLRRRPRELGEVIEVRGLGRAFCEKHGESLLQQLAGMRLG